MICQVFVSFRIFLQNGLKPKLEVAAGSRGGFSKFLPRMAQLWPRTTSFYPGELHPVSSRGEAGG